VHDGVEHADGDPGAQAADEEALGAAGGGPLLGEEQAGEGQVAGLLLGSVSGCSEASFWRRSGTSSPLSTSRQNSAGFDIRYGMSSLCSTVRKALSSGFLALGRIWVSRRTKRREWRVSSPISWSR